MYVLYEIIPPFTHTHTFMLIALSHMNEREKVWWKEENFYASYTSWCFHNSCLLLGISPLPPIIFLPRRLLFPSLDSPRVSSLLPIIFNLLLRFLLFKFNILFWPSVIKNLFKKFEKKKSFYVHFYVSSHTFHALYRVRVYETSFIGFEK